METKNKDIMEIIKATGRIFYGDTVVAQLAPQDTGDLELFTLACYVSDDDLQKEYISRGLIPASILSLCEYDDTHRDILDEKKYVGTHWKDAEGEWCFAAFIRWRGGRRVSVYRSVNGWDGSWCFAGVRKSSSQTLRPSDIRHFGP